MTDPYASSNAKIYAAIADLAEANAKLLTDPRHRNKSYDLNANKALSFREVAGVIGEALGKPVPFVSTTREEGHRAVRLQGCPAGGRGAHRGLLERRG